MSEQKAPAGPPKNGEITPEVWEAHERRQVEAAERMKREAEAKAAKASRK